MDNWKSLYIYFISGTGNARVSSEWIADEAGKKGLKTVVQQIDRLENIVMPLADEKPLIGFAFPTHGFKAAPIMLRFIAGFPPGLCKEVFLLNTRAGMKLYKLFMPGLSGVALLLPAFILWLKGYKCIGFRPVDLPSNWIPLHPGLKKKVMATAFWIIFTAVNAQIFIFIINTLNIQPDVWWWKLTAQVIGIGGMILIVTVLYRIMHYAMGLKAVKYLARFTSLTALPFWRRYRFLKNSKNHSTSVKEEVTASGPCS
ncbi:MAG: hypothetical protein WCG82_10820 [Bacteroidota bacterium]